MEPADFQQIALAVGGVLCLTALWVTPLLGFVIWMGRRAAADRAQVLASWQALARDFGLTLQNQAGPFELIGQHRGRKVSVYGRYGTRHASPYTYVSVSAGFQANVLFQLTARRALGVEYTPSGEAELDRRYGFRGRPAELLSRVVREGRVRQLIDQARPDILTATARDVYVRVWGVEKDERRLRAMIELVSEVAEVIQGEIGVSIPPSPPSPDGAYDEADVTSIKLVGAARMTVLIGAVVLACFVCVLAAAFILPAFQTVLGS